MAKRYAIASYLPLEARRVAVEATYRKHRTPDGYCPLGVALKDMEAAGLVTMAPSHLTRKETPTAGVVANTLTGTDKTQWWAVHVAAHRFIEDWTKGRIPLRELATALGVED